MPHSIHFRSRYGYRERTGASGKEIRNRSPESSSIRIANPSDDARDIVWGRSTDSEVYVRDRYTPSSIGISVFMPGNISGEKSLWKEQITEALRNSALSLHYPYSEELFIGNEKLPRLDKNLVFIITPSIELVDYDLWMPLSESNDLVFLTMILPYEKDPGDTVFESSTIGRGYREVFSQRLQEIEKRVYGGKSSVLFLDKDEDIILRLNHFFRHHHG